MIGWAVMSSGEDGRDVPQGPVAAPETSIQARLDEAVRALRRRRRLAWDLLLGSWIVIGLLAGVLAWMRLIAGSAVFGSEIACAIAFGAVLVWTQRDHESRILPLLAEEAGVTWRRSGYAFGRDLPASALPSAFGSNPVMAPKGRSSAPIFRGVVAVVLSSRPLPPFVVHPDDPTPNPLGSPFRIGWGASRRMAGGTAPNGQAVSLWQPVGLDESDRIRTVDAVAILAVLNARFRSEASFVGLMSQGASLLLIVSHPRPLLNLGSLMMFETNVLLGFREARDDLLFLRGLADTACQAEAMAQASGRRAVPA